jgi:hypothetical protein
VLLIGLSKQLALASAITSLLGTRPAGNPADTGIFISQAIKGAQAPYVVLHLVDGPPAASSLDGVSELIEGEPQFDSYASDPTIARKLSRAVRDYFKNFSGALPDGTTIQFVDVTMDGDDNYEVGGTGYIFRSFVRLKAFYTEAP